MVLDPQALGYIPGECFLRTPGISYECWTRQCLFKLAGFALMPLATELFKESNCGTRSHWGAFGTVAVGCSTVYDNTTVV